VGNGFASGGGLASVPKVQPTTSDSLPSGSERAWWRQVGIDPVEVARELWRKARVSDGTLQPSLGTAPNGLDAAVCPDGEIANARCNEEGPHHG